MYAYKDTFYKIITLLLKSKVKVVFSGISILSHKIQYKQTYPLCTFIDMFSKP